MPLGIERRDNRAAWQTLASEHPVDDCLAIDRPTEGLAQGLVLEQWVAVADRRAVLECRACVERDLTETRRGGRDRRDFGDLLQGLIHAEVKAVGKIDLSGLQCLPEGVRIVVDLEDDLIDGSLAAVPVGVGLEPGELPRAPLDHHVRARANRRRLRGADVLELAHLLAVNGLPDVLGENEHEEVVHDRAGLGDIYLHREVVQRLCAHHVGDIRAVVRPLILAVDDPIERVGDVLCGDRDSIAPLHPRTKSVGP
ncbi:unannotated protein [freshwater metagenome]|uniref:Unannotated protein n=1 Tax=freshwater metagenome TaxID=449393 RepID=A0A6J6TAS9_9ZZZZ